MQMKKVSLIRVAIHVNKILSVFKYDCFSPAGNEQQVSLCVWPQDN